MRDKFFVSKVSPEEEEKLDELLKETQPIEKVKEEEAVVIPMDRGFVLGEKQCYVRESSSVSSRVIGQLSPGQEVSITDEVFVGGQKKPVWYQVKLKDGAVGFVSAGHIEIL